MMMTDAQQRIAAQQFANDWKGKGYEKGESQPFWLSLLNHVFGIKNPEKYIHFEDQVHLDHTSFIDGFIPETHVLIEQKSIGKDLRAPIKQSDGTLLSPFQQAKRYAAELPYSTRPRWIVCCNFQEFLIYDMERPNGEPESVLLQNLEKEYYRLNFLVDMCDGNIRREMEVSLKAGELVGKLYDALLPQYVNPESAETLHSLNILCVRLVFCLYAEDAGFFGKHNAFGNYLRAFDSKMVRKTLLELFDVLATPITERDPYLIDSLKNFPYVNGGLFDKDMTQTIEIPNFTDEIVRILISDCSDNFNWRDISPTIFGAVFESTLNPVTRRSGGMHYTSLENIHKVIDPLFLNDLKNEFTHIIDNFVSKERKNRLLKLQSRIANLKFLDPACGSGNFLTETYISLRRLENEILKLLRNDNQILMGFEEVSPIKISIGQFYGIEINDFAVTVAKAALWIAEAQMLQETQDIISINLDFFPLKSYANIREGNALQMDWRYFPVHQTVKDVYAKKTTIVEVGGNACEPPIAYENIRLYTNEIEFNSNPQPQLHRVEFDYIMGNPPFVGHQWRSKEQQEDMDFVFKDWKTYGKLDYVACWYKKANDIINEEKTKCAFVSTNSICQGESVAVMWKPLFQSGLEIDFAYRTFRWDSESSRKAHVHCVIIGFSSRLLALSFQQKKKMIVDEQGIRIDAQNINGYLINASNIFIEGRGKPMSKKFPVMTKGSQPTDGGNLLLSEKEKENLIKDYPFTKKWIKQFIGAEEYINNKKRYCLWLVNANPTELKHCKPILERIKKVRELRLQSPTKSVQCDADTPTLFTQRRQPDKDYIVVPETSSEKRKYIPIGFVSADIVCGNAIRYIPNADLYMFGILTSHIHNAWMRAVCGRLKSDYRYSPAIYNNFPWCSPTLEQKSKIEKTAQAILDARTLYPDSSLADLYDEATMPAELRKAHQANDKAVMQAYGFPVTDFSESDCVAKLFELYQTLIEDK